MLGNKILSLPLLLLSGCAPEYELKAKDTSEPTDVDLPPHDILDLCSIGNIYDYVYLNEKGGYDADSEGLITSASEGLDHQIETWSDYYTAEDFWSGAQPFTALLFGCHHRGLVPGEGLNYDYYRAQIAIIPGEKTAELIPALLVDDGDFCSPISDYFDYTAFPALSVLACNTFSWLDYAGAANTGYQNSFYAGQGLYPDVCDDWGYASPESETSFDSIRMSSYPDGASETVYEKRCATKDEGLASGSVPYEITRSVSENIEERSDDAYDRVMALASRSFHSTTGTEYVGGLLYCNGEHCESSVP
ncbi:MAG: hypothetical protein ACD_62C00345G0004 [uncultured bacterium]|nr:MAG: hypothetical protein ACD_62C00345G0004 [uncultured bacterium]HLD45153.1 hypothetical protein [bacterium]